MSRTAARVAGLLLTVLLCSAISVGGGLLAVRLARPDASPIVPFIRPIEPTADTSSRWQGGRFWHWRRVDGRDEWGYDEGGRFVRVGYCPSGGSGR